MNNLSSRSSQSIFEVFSCNWLEHCSSNCSTVIRDGKDYENLDHGWESEEQDSVTFRISCKRLAGWGSHLGLLESTESCCSTISLDARLYSHKKKSPSVTSETLHSSVHSPVRNSMQPWTIRKVWTRRSETSKAGFPPLLVVGAVTS